MGIKMKKIWDYVEQEGKKIAVLRVIIASGVHHSNALQVPDDEEKIERLISAAKKVLNKTSIPVE